MSYCKQLLQAESDLRTLQNRVEWLKSRAMDEMDSNYLDLGKYGRLELKKTRSKPDTESVAAIKLEIELEKQKLHSQNISSIYELQRIIFMSHVLMESLLSNPLIEELESKLSEEAKERKYLEVKLNKPDLSNYFTPEVKASLYSSAKSVTKESGTPLTRAAVNEFMHSFSLGKYGDLSINDAWGVRCEQHYKLKAV